MSSPPDFLGLALGMLRQRQQNRAQQQSDTQQNALAQARFDAQMRQATEARQQEALRLATTLISQNYKLPAVLGLVGDDLPESYRPFLKEAEKRAQAVAEQKAATPSAEGQQDIVSGIAAAMQNQSDPLKAALAGARATPDLPGLNNPDLTNQWLARAGGLAAETQRGNQEFNRRTALGTNENLRQFYGQESYRNVRDTVSIVVAPQAARPGLPAGFNTIVGRDKANALIASSGGLIREVPLSLNAQKPEDIGLQVPTATTVKLYDRLEFIGEQRRAMKRIADNYDPTYLEYLGQAKAGLSSFAQKLGIRTTQELQDYSAGYNTFKSDLGNNLMAIVQQRAATTFTDRLLNQMKSWNLSPDLSDSEFRNLYKQMSFELDMNYARTIWGLKNDPVTAAEAADSGDIPIQKRNQWELKYSDTTLQKIMRSTEHRAAAEAIRGGASVDEAAQAGVDAVQQKFFTPEPGAR